jgi:dTDP-4-amino-4,6-dideoxygalactose transaminase
MRKIEMVDLRSQYLKIKREIDTGIQEVIDSAIFLTGGKTAEFQHDLEQYLGVRHVIPVANGTDALTVSLMSLGLQAGDEVITSAFSFIAAAEAIAFLGLKPVFADVEPDTFNISAKAVRRAITPRTKAIIPVHLFGQNADMETLLDIASRHGSYIIEDACQSIGAVYSFAGGKKAQAGCMGDMGCMSFFPSKNLGCYGDGGAIFTNSDRIASAARVIASHGCTVRYRHDRIGINSRLDAIQAAVLQVKLKHLDSYIAARRQVADFYNKAFAGNNHIILPAQAENSTHVFHQYTIKLKDANREKLRQKLHEHGIPTMVYYPVPLHLQKAFGGCGYAAGDFPVSERLSESVLSLPVHSEMDSGQLAYIAQKVLDEIEN